MALGKESITEVRTDKTGSTGDENVHGSKSIGAGIDLSRLALCRGSVNSPAIRAGFAYEIASYLPKVLISRHRLGGVVVGHWLGTDFGSATNDDAQKRYLVRLCRRCIGDGVDGGR